METETADPQETQVNEDEREPATVLLDFSETVERPVGVAPDGTAYEVKTLDEFGLAEEHKLRAQRQRFGTLQDQRKHSVKDAAEHAKLLADMFDAIVVAPDNVKATFNDRQKQKVVAFFTGAQLSEDRALAEAALKLANPQGESITEN